MENRSIQPGDLKVRRLLWVFAVLALLLLGALAIAPARSYFSEWRAAQERYNELAHEQSVKPVQIRIHQIWKAEIGVVDRCQSCHLGMGAAKPLRGDRLFAAHPPTPHPPHQFGCTTCHAGQGRATTAAAAHGRVRFWEEPMLEPGYYQAGCGTCHSSLPLTNFALAERGRKLVHQTGCLKCHRVNAEGKTRLGAPDLSSAGLKGFDPRWHDRHSDHSGGLWEKHFTPLSGREVKAATGYLRSLVGAPRLMAGKSLAHRLGCRGCHRINGVGGDDGPDLSRMGLKPVGELDLSTLRGPRTLSHWLVEHFLDPAGIEKGSKMPNLGLTRKQAESLTVYMLSLRQRTLPELVAPPDRIRAQRLGEREFPTDGESLFGVFCAACHGERGRGRSFQTFNAIFPAIGRPDFLAVASDQLIARTITEGRPGRRMPSWGKGEGGLRGPEIQALVKYLRSLEPPAPTLKATLAAPVDPALGRRLFHQDCAGCHGAEGEGSVLAPPLAAADNLATKEDSRIYGTLTVGVPGTAMGRFRTFGAKELRAVIAAVRELPKKETIHRSGWKFRRGDALRGRGLFSDNCVNCHGKMGKGKDGPAVGNPAFLAAATDGYLVATIIRGRSQKTGREGKRAMPHFGAEGPDHKKLRPVQVADLVAFLRSLESSGRGSKKKGPAKRTKGVAPSPR